MADDDASRTREETALRVRDFYQEHPYPRVVDDIAAQREAWDDARRRAEWHLLFPDRPVSNEHAILIAGCGTAQAARHAARWPQARVVGIDVSESSLAHEAALKKRYNLVNLELHALALERAPELGEHFDRILCTGVIHHLFDPVAGLRALESVLAEGGVVELMVYAPYGRAGVYLLQRYCKQLGIGTTREEISELATALRALPPDHPIVPLLQASPDFQTIEGVADALLNPCDRAYSVPDLFALLASANLAFARWRRQAPYLPSCGAIARTSHRALLEALAPQQQFEAMELFRGSMTRHTVFAVRPPDSGPCMDFESERFADAKPIRLPHTVEVRDKLPHGSSAVLINRDHTFTDLYLPIDHRQERVLRAIDGMRTVADIERRLGEPALVRTFLESLWAWDQIVFEARV